MNDLGTKDRNVRTIACVAVFVLLQLIKTNSHSIAMVLYQNRPDTIAGEFVRTNEFITNHQGTCDQAMVECIKSIST